MCVNLHGHPYLEAVICTDSVHVYVKEAPTTLLYCVCLHFVLLQHKLDSLPLFSSLVCCGISTSCRQAMPFPVRPPLHWNAYQGSSLIDTSFFVYKHKLIEWTAIDFKRCYICSHLFPGMCWQVEAGDGRFRLSTCFSSGSWGGTTSRSTTGHWRHQG